MLGFINISNYNLYPYSIFWSWYYKISISHQLDNHLGDVLRLHLIIK